MRKLLLSILVLLLMAPTLASASLANTSFWGWVGEYASYTEQGQWTTVYSWKLYRQYKCKLNESYLDYEVQSVHRKEFVIDTTQYINWTMDRVYCKVRDYQCSCLYR